jgi:hypothetical protein
MSIHTHKAKEIFDDAKNHLDPRKDPVMWDLVNGLSELCDALNQLQNDVHSLKQKLQAR